MDPDVARMMADLGLERRDVVSAPTADGKGRGAREDPRAQAAIAADFEARRTRILAGGPNDERAARLRAWNTETTFELDAVTDQLENRFSGQGHRAGLQRHHEYDERWESVDARVGEERRLYLQQRGGNSVPSNNHGRFSGETSGNHSAIPRSFSGGHNSNDRGRAAPSRAPNHARAPSPRTFGTVRFRPGGLRVEQPSTGLRTVSNPGVAAAAALRAAAATRAPAKSPAASPTTRPSTSAAGPSTTPSVVSSIKPSAQPVASNVATAPRVSKQPTAVASPAAQPSISTGSDTFRLRRTPTPSSTRSTSLVPITRVPSTVEAHDHIAAQSYHNLALWHAAHPGKECDAYHDKYPDRRRYFATARDQLVRETITLAKNGDDQDTSQYLRTHKPRRWMVEAAAKAKWQVENATQEEIDAFCNDHPHHWLFVHAAKAVFLPQKQSAEGVQDQDVPMRDDRRSSSDTMAGSESSGGSFATNISAPISAALGKITAAFYDVAGTLLGTHKVDVCAPCNVEIKFDSATARYDPRQLIHGIEALAQKMVEMSNRQSENLEGARLADDGLWESDEEL